MTYVIAEPCIGEKNGACVDVCPAGCIHTTPEAPQNYIDPAVCIECEQCVLVCPVNAVFLDQELPAEWVHFTEVNAGFFQTNKPLGTLTSAEATGMVAAVAAYAARSGLTVSVTVLDREGSILTAEGADAEEAARRAYTALMYGIATHELQPTSKPLWRQPSEIDVSRVLMTPGGYPVIEGVETLGAVGVAGAPAAQVMLCCQAAVEFRFSHSPL
ncbi:MAG: ferredoxin family protein [Chloroflexi bacterium]|nr:ferredoxin family protein [Chloroflexota bacterium]